MPFPLIVMIFIIANFCFFKSVSCCHIVSLSFQVVLET